MIRVRLARRVSVGAIAVAWVAGCEIVAGQLPSPRRSTQGAAGGAGAAGTGEAGAAGGTGAAAGTGGEGGAAGGGGPGGAGDGAAAAGGSSGAGAGGSGGCANPCDCDGDGHLAKGAACKGDDCDDADERAFPGEADYYDTPTKGTQSFDFDCNGTPDKDPAIDKALNCGPLDALACNGQKGYAGGIPGCGVEGDWAECKWETTQLKCVQSGSTKQRMRCR